MERARLQDAGVATAAHHDIEIALRLSEEWAGKEAEVRRSADSLLHQTRVELHVQTQRLKKAVSEKDCQIRTTRDKKLKQIESEMSQRRETIRAQLESRAYGQSLDLSTTASTTPPVETTEHVSDAADMTSKIAAETSLPFTLGPPPALEMGLSPTTAGTKIGASETQCPFSEDSSLPPADIGPTSQGAHWVGSMAQDDHFDSMVLLDSLDNPIRTTPPFEIANHDGQLATNFTPTHDCCAYGGHDYSGLCFQCMLNESEHCLLS